MTGRLIVDLGEDGTVTVGTLAGDGELPSAAGCATLSWPLDGEALEDLRWYLEDYLIAPFGVYGDRGARVGASLGEWGEAVFSSVFGSGPARDAYLGMRARGEVEVVFRSASPSLLGLPWELMSDPGRGRPLALEAAGVGRSLLMPPDAPETVAVPGGRLRVLMVISRPAGAGDVGYRMIARPLLERLEAVRGAVDLVVLRPPTLDALRGELASAAAAGMPYQVVHFDGHGVMPGRRSGAGGGLTFGAGQGEGVLVFEGPDGSADQVPASRVAQVLAGARVPVVVLNACQSGAVGKELEAAVATRLLGEGIASVVAMAYSVYAVAAAEFMAAFYEKLFTSGTVSAAVAAGRQQMWRNPARPSPKGDLPLADWLVPVHYFRREVRFPQAAVPRPTELGSLPEALAAISATPGVTGRGDLDAIDGVFVGRDAQFYDLEAAARLQKVVVLVGPGGTGKTELAKAFARWWRDTGGVERPEWVFWHSFEPGVATFGLDGVIGEIGLGLYGEQFALLERRQRHAVVLKALTEHRMLLVWDNFESVRSMPDPGRATQPLDQAGCDELREFLAVVAADGRSSVLVTSRTAEDWLGGIRRITVGGLAAHEAAEYASLLLAPYPAARQRRAGATFGDLMQWLDGHPLSMRLVLPRLDSDSPETLLAGLQGTVPLSGDDTDAGRTSSLAASVSYSYAHLTGTTQRLLPAVSLFHTVADANVLASFSQVSDVPERFRGAGTPDWTAALDDAATVGLLTSLDAGIYRIHPALQGYLAAAWRRDDAASHDTMREAAIRAFLTAHAILCLWLFQQITSGAAGLAYTVISLERHTLGSLLGYALDHALWREAQAIIQPLDGYWGARGLDDEAGTWTDRVHMATEGPDDAPPRLDTPAGDLWLFVTGSQASRELQRHRLDSAERTYRLILTTLQAQQATPGQLERIAGTYHQLGWVAQDRGQLDDAEAWYRKALTIWNDLSDQPGLAATYHQLGRVALERGKRDDAEAWSLKSLTIEEKLSDQPHLAGTYHQLGMIAQDRGQLDDAEAWYRKALTIWNDLSDQPGLAATYHQLGWVALDRGQLDDAEAWSLKSLTIEEKLSNRPGLASSYHQLGILSQRRGQLDDAEAWYLKSLTIKEDLNDQPHLTATYYQLGRVAQGKGRLADAVDWYQKSLAIEEELGDRPGMASTYHQLGVVAQARGDLGTAAEWYQKSLALKEELGDQSARP